jgi:HSP20 family protein
MTLRRDPLRELLDLQERMNRLFDATLTRERLEEPGFLQGSWLPVADVLETPEAYVVELELPGLGRDDVDVQFHGDELVVRGERHPCGSEAFHRLERRYGPFARAFRFSAPVEPGRVEAEFSDGILRLTVPKALPRPGTRVRVERGG